MAVTRGSVVRRLALLMTLLLTSLLASGVQANMTSNAIELREFDDPVREQR